jgi:hypothetical protein
METKAHRRYDMADELWNGIEGLLLGGKWKVGGRAWER